MTRYPLTFYVKSLPPGVGGEARGPVREFDMERLRYELNRQATNPRITPR